MKTAKKSFEETWNKPFSGDAKVTCAKKTCKPYGIRNLKFPEHASRLEPEMDGDSEKKIDHAIKAKCHQENFEKALTTGEG